MEIALGISIIFILLLFLEIKRTNKENNNLRLRIGQLKDEVEYFKETQEKH